MTKLKKSNCDDLKTQIVTKHKKSNRNKSQQLITKVVMKLKKKTKIVTTLKLCDKTPKTQTQLLTTQLLTSLKSLAKKTTLHLKNRLDVVRAAFCNRDMFFLNFFFHLIWD